MSAKSKMASETNQAARARNRIKRKHARRRAKPVESHTDENFKFVGPKKSQPDFGEQNAKNQAKRARRYA